MACFDLIYIGIRARRNAGHVWLEEGRAILRGREREMGRRCREGTGMWFSIEGIPGFTEMLGILGVRAWIGTGVGYAISSSGNRGIWTRYVVLGGIEVAS